MRILLRSVIVILLGCSAIAQVPTYSVGPHDVLAISVFDHPNLSGKFSVEADGTFTFPLLGRVKAGGRSLQDVESELRRLLEQGYLKNPQVSVAVDQYQSQRIFVVGEVRAPGMYPLSGEMTLIEALARAGSLTERALNEAVIVHARPGANMVQPQLPTDVPGSDVVRVNLKELQSGAISQNVLLRDGDTIFVPRTESVYVFGEVRNPGAYPLQGDTTVLQALSMAGGVTRRASTRRLQIVRIVGGKKQEIKVKFDDPVRPGDTVLVAERFF